MLGINATELVQKYNVSAQIARKKGVLKENKEIAKAKLELEARFHNVKPHEFMRVYNKYRTESKYEVSEDYLYTLTDSKVTYRHTITNEEDSEEQYESWISKEENYAYSSTDYNIKIAINTEEYIHMNVDDSEEIPLYNGEVLTYRISRKKERWEIPLDEYNSTLMLTKVLQEDELRYEVEVEMSNQKLLNGELWENFVKAILAIYKVLFDTTCVYTTTEKRALISYVNKLFKIEDDEEIAKGILNEARNLKHKDLVWGGIVGNENYTYNVTDKADGLRCILIVNRLGVWVVSPGYKYNLLKRINWKVENNMRYREDLIGLICEGEDIPIENRLSINDEEPVQSICYIQFFDILSLPPGNIKVRDMTHTQRREYLKNQLSDNNFLGKVVERELLTFGLKSFYVINGVDEFFSKVKQVLSIRHNYKTDGIIFTPENEGYDPRANRGDVSYDRRILTRMTDICKWKQEITMDLKIGKDRALYSVRGIENIPFAGSELVRYDPRSYLRKFIQKSNNGDIDVNLDTLAEGTVVEFAYRDGILTPLRVRYDKTTPNPSFVILDNWKYILDPITENTMIGESTNLMRKYHNKIKRKLFDRISSTGNPTLLDIASGKGGDVTKWTNFSKIVAVEPNKDNLRDLRKRVSNNEMDDRVRIVNTVGQDTESITNAVREHIGDKADYCSIMLGFSFFWESEESFNSLIRTILENTKRGIIFLTIDGDSVEQSWYPAFSITKLIGTLRIGNDFIDYQRNRNPPIRVNIGHIVNMQDEYLVYLEDLIRYFTPEFIYRADQEKFMNMGEKKLSSMYTYGYLIISKDAIIPEKSITLPEVSEASVEDVIEEVYLDILPEVDMIQELKSSYTETLVRISSMDTETFLDSYLKGFDPSYQENDNPKFRKDYIRRLRNDIADKFDKAKLWDVVGEGILIRLLTKELTSNAKKLEYTLSSLLSSLANSSIVRYIDMLIITEIIGVDVIILDTYERGLSFLYTTYSEGKSEKLVILSRIVHNDIDHYDLIGLLSSEGIVTLFSSEDDIIKEILAGEDIEKYSPENTENYYMKTIISKLHRFEPINNKGYIIFNQFKRVSKTEPYHKRLTSIYNVTKSGGLAISKNKIDKQKSSLGVKK